MTILVLSDTHYDLRNAKKAAEMEKPDVIWHLGDMLLDAEELSKALPNIPVVRVRGNNDYSGRQYALETAGGYKFFLTHGHAYYVNSTCEPLAAAASSFGAYAALFGHTHAPMLTYREKEKLWLFNPGSISKPQHTRAPSYGRIVLGSGEPSIKLIEMK